MFIPFDSISPASRIWIYQADRKFTDKEIAEIRAYLEKFTRQWSAHSQELKTSFDIRFNQFILLAADEAYNSTSGCSIDSSVRAVKEIETHIGVDLFNRNLIAFKKSDDVILIPLSELKQKYADGTWNEDTITFNNLVSLKNQLENEWLVNAGHTWLKRYVPARVSQ